MKLLIIFLFTSFSALAQSEKAIKLNVESMDMKLAGPGGVWSEWREFGKQNQSIEDHTLTINFTNKTITTDFKLKEAEREFHSFKIISFSHDQSYEDVGFYTTSINVDEGNGVIKRYLLAYNSCDKQYRLITCSDKVRTRYLLKEL